jgi:hypothetical protein
MRKRTASRTEYIHARSHMQLHADTRRHMQTHAVTRRHTQTHAVTRRHTQTHAYMPTCMQAGVLAPRLCAPPLCVTTLLHMHAHEDVCKYETMHACMDACMGAHVYTYTRTVHYAHATTDTRKHATSYPPSYQRHPFTHERARAHAKAYSHEMKKAYAHTRIGEQGHKHTHIRTYAAQHTICSCIQFQHFRITKAGMRVCVYACMSRWLRKCMRRGVCVDACVVVSA